ncbi:cyclic beta 1-2 glucan synthetase [Luteibacter jiangsuensis]|uniref:Cyclic beta 1-2 glucan synthetase n=2 Tax=Luteibacter jiangsuensis TaxID=637577 RepID=A0ABX0Q543_9GAMM|nr:cyclic beta 1-2 glucan synthetase [Luteibacter jiangsuensis]
MDEPVSRPTGKKLIGLGRRGQGLSADVEREPLIRAELFNADQLEAHGPFLAHRHHVASKRTPEWLVPRLADNERIILEACRGLMSASRQGEATTPAGVWLLDNLYLVEEQIDTAKRDFPDGYSRELVQLDDGPSKGLPRVYDAALEVIAHGDGRVDESGLARFLTSYQSVTPLSLGELWAVPIMLRMALIENLRRIAVRLTHDRAGRRRAARWANAMTRMAAEDAKNVVLVVADMARSAPVMTAPFVAELVRRLQGQGPALAMPLSWVEQRLAESGQSIDYLVQMESQQQAAQQVSMSNSIGSLRALAMIDWQALVERTSLVDAALREDPAGVYGRMDFASRDDYRHRIERLARKNGLDEVHVARAVLDASLAGQGLSSHVGYHLHGNGLPALRRRLGIRSSRTDRDGTAVSRSTFGLSMALFVGLTLALTTVLLGSGSLEHFNPVLIVILVLAAAILASQFALGLLNLAATVLTRPDRLPRMDYSKGIPIEASTMVVVPTLLGNPGDVDELVDALEIRFLANRDACLRFALLTDFTDAVTPSLPGDPAILQRAHDRVDALNARYASGGPDLFFLFHRPREWSDTEQCWIGADRKRGKLAALNALLRGQGRSRFQLVVGRLEHLPHIRYVITLDTDTHLPRDAAHLLVGAMDHPLNRPVFDAAHTLVTSGYGIMQPRIGIALPAQARSLHARLYGADAGVDPYTRATSDVYQDLFHEGSFIGKGIYDIDAFEHAMADRFRPERVLSHDLIEGCVARSALLTDVLVFEGTPDRYLDESQRRHRWMRGDWQLLPWLLPMVPAAGKWRRNDLSSLSRWKIFDNLRRSLVPAATWLLLVVGWLAMTPLVTWTLAVLSMALLPILLQAFMEAVRKPRDIDWRQQGHVALAASGAHAARLAIAIASLPHDAYSGLDAMVRSVWRIAVSRRHLLEWRSSGLVSKQGRHRHRVPWAAMWPGPASALAVFALLAFARPLAIVVASPWLVLWATSPVIAWWVSRAPTSRRFVPNEGDLAFLRKLARRTWGFFEVHGGPDDHGLPPDNLQMVPQPRLARRTSPTNIGLGLLAGFAAYDFGYLGTGRLLERTAATLATLGRLERYRGHFLNWYDTETLQPLHPRYVSSVDSGNLAGHLMTLRQGLLGLVDDPVFRRESIAGLRDTLDVLADSLTTAPPPEWRVWAQVLTSAADAPPASLGEVLAFAEEQRVRAEALRAGLTHEPSDDAAFWLGRLVAQCDDLMAEATCWSGNVTGTPSLPSLAELAAETGTARGECARSRIAVLKDAAAIVGHLSVMDQAFMYDEHRRLFSIGYDLERHVLDVSFYDLLASEARLTTFVAIAQGQVLQESWFSLGRLLTRAHGLPVLLSWTGSMFEYLMPMLVMPTYEGSLLDETLRNAVARQIDYGKQRGVPWGVSESGYHAVDASMTYQYRAFGVPGLGLKRGLGDDLVVAPYATALALMVSPAAATANLRRLSEAGMAGRYGLYEALDYTPSRLRPGQDSAIVQSYMSHHQGMSLLAIGHALLDKPMQRRFEADPNVMATSLLLQERLPLSSSEYLRHTGMGDSTQQATGAESQLRLFTDPNRPRPAVQLLSNGRYHVMVSSAGGGYSRRDAMAVTRWREDITRDNHGMFCYLRDPSNDEVWSTTYQPTMRETDSFEAIFAESRAEFRVRQRAFETHTEIVVSPEDDIELRRTRITNRHKTRRTVELTSYAELVLADAASDTAHPAFSKLFVTTEIVASMQALLCTRRGRSAAEKPPWACHLAAVHDADIDEISYETDRARFIGRGRSAADPLALAPGSRALSGTAGPVLDPIAAIRVRITLEPEQTATLDFVTGVGDDRGQCMRLIEKYRDRHLSDRVFDLAWTHSQVTLRQANATLADAQLFEHMATSIIYANRAMRAAPSMIAANTRGQSGLWGQAVSGDLPIVLLRIGDIARLDIARDLIRAAAYWRLRGLAVDLVIWNEDSTGYRQALHEALIGLLASGAEASLLDRPGGVYIRAAQPLSYEDRLVMEASARIVVVDTLGSLQEQMERHRMVPAPAIAEPAGWLPRIAEAKIAATQATGEFSADGTEYVITSGQGATTPAPWCNVLANPGFGSVVSESGSAYTWSGNAHGCRLTPWQNDPVEDACGEALYLRDEATGHAWSPSPLPMRGEGAYTTRHGFGYSVFEHAERDVATRLEVFVARDAPLKFQVLSITNKGSEELLLTATGYVEWVLGDIREKNAMHIVTDVDPTTGALFARNAYNGDFPGRVAFFDVGDNDREIGGDRGDFLGRNGRASSPLALRRQGWSNRVGAGLDPCGALRVSVRLAPGESRDLVFRLGMGDSEAEARELVQRYRQDGAAARELAEVRARWSELLGAVQVRSPEPAVDVFANGWLLYQTIASRIWARSGYYQSGGAIGFRDQLQDSMAMLHADPTVARAQLLTCAGRQFIEGDVQHWWHPPSGRGVRTTCSDDFLWLPLAASRYARATADTMVLDEAIEYIEMRALRPGEESVYDLPRVSGTRETLYEHCVRALEHAMSRGTHGLPLIGGGDWNDGMNRIGEGGKGESVWLAFFLMHVLREFAPLAAGRGDAVFAAHCDEEANRLAANVEAHAWDGEWYLRAWFDDGTPLGSAANDECRIDAVAQSWSVLSGGAPDGRAREAMRSVDAHLVRPDAGLIQLLDPPFDKTAMDPGYIKGYLPGVRENGGQYTHAAVWVAMAFARLGQTEHAWDLARMILPSSHTADAASMATYKVEPYVLAADVYAVEPHVGRGGWTWYTGSAGWMYRLLIESLFGISLVDGRLSIVPCVPAAWDGYSVTYRHGSSTYDIELRRAHPDEAVSLTLDGEAVEGNSVQMTDDSAVHQVLCVYCVAPPTTDAPSTDRQNPTPHEIREAGLRDYDKAAATNPKACAMRVCDASGKVHALGTISSSEGLKGGTRRSDWTD